VPQVRGKVDVAEVSTPLSTQHFTNYGHGEIYGLAHDPARFAERALKPKTPVPGLWLTDGHLHVRHRGALAAAT